MFAVLISCLLVFSVSADLMTDRIPNALTATGLTAGLLLASERAGPPGLFTVFKDVLFMFFLTFLLFRLHAMRGGDGKLLCALTALLGFQTGISILLYSMLLASFFGAGVFLWRMCKKKKEAGDKEQSHGNSGRTWTKIHYSVPIMLATLVCLPKII
ncbi:MAG: prepilin peptidase [Lachnospiraceae bacterium]|nr:prepilin peptidase [Lachnospiraceae bacterium]MBR6158540.1 prepilin peptidase [Lachnospiraceae bacterium]